MIRRMWCADCGEPLVPIHETATLRCCQGAYQTDVGPEAKDAWFARPRTKQGLHFYAPPDWNLHDRD